MRKLIDKLMLRLGYFPKSRVCGNTIIVERKKFELILFKGEKVMSRHMIMSSAIPIELLEAQFKRELLQDAMKRIDEITEWQTDYFDTDLNFRVRSRFWLAIPKK